VCSDYEEFFTLMNDKSDNSLYNITNRKICQPLIRSLLGNEMERKHLTLSLSKVILRERLEAQEMRKKKKVKEIEIQIER